MAFRKRFLAIPVALGALVLTGSLVLTATIATSASAKASTSSSTASGTQAVKLKALERALLHSHELWATIDVCDPADQPSTVGIRGSMPGDGHAHDSMYMSFRLQYMSASGRWVNLSSGASSGFVAVGTGASARQGGTSFELKPVAGKPAVTLRGVVDFQWRRGKTVIVSGAEPTTAAHKSLAGADPEGYSAASCIIG
jgi:hypothetical protein